MSEYWRLLIGTCDKLSVRAASERTFTSGSALSGLTSPRDRKDDISPLCNYFLIKHGRNGQEAQIAPDALGNLLNYEWPGNVRELENVIQRAVVSSGGDPISSAALLMSQFFQVNLILMTICPRDGVWNPPRFPNISFEEVKLRWLFNPRERVCTGNGGKMSPEDI